MKRKSIILLICFVTLFTTSSVFNHKANAAPADILLSPYGEMTQTELTGTEKQNYLNMLQNSTIFKDTVSQTGTIEPTSQVVKIKYSNDPEFAEGVVQISGVLADSPNDGFDGFIDVEMGQVLEVISYKAQGTSPTSIVKISDYYGNGSLVNEGTTTYGNLADTSATVSPVTMNNVIKIDDPNDPVTQSLAAVNPKALKWACRFSSYVACVGLAGGCTVVGGPLAGLICGLACRLAFQHFACRG